MLKMNLKKEVRDRRWQWYGSRNRYKIHVTFTCPLRQKSNDYNI